MGVMRAIKNKMPAVGWAVVLSVSVHCGAAWCLWDGNHDHHSAQAASFELVSFERMEHAGHAKPGVVSKSTITSEQNQAQQPVADALSSKAQSATSTEGSAPALATPMAGNQRPVYPELARRRGLEGLVLVEAQLDNQGHVMEVRPRQSSGHALLDNAALNAVKSWRFDTAFAGKRVQVPVRFRLSDPAFTAAMTSQP